MKSLALNGSFGKVLAAAATFVFMISLTSPAQAQQGQWGNDNCFYSNVDNPVMPSGQPGSTQVVRKGCLLVVVGRKFYYNFGTKVFTDMSSRLSFFEDQSGRWWVNANHGWTLMSQTEFGGEDPGVVKDHGMVHIDIWPTGNCSVGRNGC